MVNVSLNKCLIIQAIEVTSLGCSKTCYSSNIILEKNNFYHPLLCIVFFHKLISMQNVGHMLHLNVVWQLSSLDYSDETLSITLLFITLL